MTAITYRVTFHGVQGRIGQGTKTKTVTTAHPTAVIPLAEHAAGLTELDYTAAVAKAVR